MLEVFVVCKVRVSVAQPRQDDLDNPVGDAELNRDAQGGSYATIPPFQDGLSPPIGNARGWAKFHILFWVVARPLVLWTLRP